MPHAVEGHLLAAGIGKTLLVEPVHNGGNGLTAVVAFESFQHKRRGQRVDLKVLLCVDHITDGQRAAVELALERIVRHASNHFLRKVGRAIFCIALQNRFEDDAPAPSEMTSVAETTFTPFFLCKPHLVQCTPSDFPINTWLHSAIILPLS